MPVSRLRLGDTGMGYKNLRAIQDYVDESLVKDLKWPNSLKTYDKMHYDPSVFIALYLSTMLVEKAFTKPNVKFNVDSEESKKAAEFVEWNLKNMRGTLTEVIRDAYTFKKYGFSVLVKSYEGISSGKYSGEYPYKIKSLTSRAQKTLNKTDPFLVNADGEVEYVRQDLKPLSNTYQLFKPQIRLDEGKSYADIPRNKVMLFAYDSTNGSPIGRSPLTSAYKAWREKILIEDYQVVGTSKDLG